MAKLKIVLVGGCFDILHYGHIYFLKKAKRLGDLLVVILESDKNTRKLKGPKRPIHSQSQRAEMLRSLKFVDKVISLSPSPNYPKLTKDIRPSIIALTEGDPMFNKKSEQAKEVGAKIAVIHKIKTPSTTQLIKLLEIES